MSVPEAVAQEFSKSCLQNAFTDFLSEATPRHQAGRKSLPQTFQSVTDLVAASEYRFEGTMRIDCHVTGELHLPTGTLIVGEMAEIHADIFVAEAIIDGEVRGNIRATGRVELGSNARVMGNIQTPSLAIQPGALFDGQCHFLPRDAESVQTEIGQFPLTDLTESGPRRESDAEDKPRTMSAVAAF